jgi:hypothetical protein
VGIPVKLEKGRLGQFDIVVDGHPIVSRKGGLLAKLLRRPWPGAEDVVSAVRKALRATGEQDRVV